MFLQGTCVPILGFAFRNKAAVELWQAKALAALRKYDFPTTRNFKSMAVEVLGVVTLALPTLQALLGGGAVRPFLDALGFSWADPAGVDAFWSAPDNPMRGACAGFDVRVRLQIFLASPKAAAEEDERSGHFIDPAEVHK